MLCSVCGDTHEEGTLACPRTGETLGAVGLCGKRLDRYQVETLLGGGGMGAVYRARHTFAGHMVALKVLHPKFATNPDVLQRFQREARAATAIGSPHIVQVLDSGIAEDGTMFLAMELVEGEGLDARLERESVMPIDDSVDVARQVLDALGAAHRVGIVHRDLKPGNVLLARRNDGDRRPFVKLVDFGISKAPSPADAEILTRTGMLLGTPYYMSPEQFQSAHSVDGRTDLYALGAMLYRMLAGRHPFLATSLEELIPKVLFESPTPLASIAPNVPAALVSVIDRALARDPNARWPDAAAFSHALQQATSGWITSVRSWPGVPSAPASASATTPPFATQTPGAFPPTAAPSVPAFATPNGASPAFAIPAQPSPHAASPAFATPAHAAAHGPNPAFAALPAPHMVFPPGTTAPASPARRTRVWIVIGGSVVALVAVTSIAAVRLLGSDDDDAAPSAASAVAPSAPSAPPAMPMAFPTAPPAPPQAMFAPSGEPNPTPSQPRAAPPGGVSIDDVHPVGGLNGDLRAAVERALPQMRACRRPGPVQQVEALAIINEGGSVPIARQGNNNTGDDAIANCVAHAFQGSAPVPITGDGILSFTVTIGGP